MTLGAARPRRSHKNPVTASASPITTSAIRETAPVNGLQVHRSHWVALDAVSRTYRDAVRAAGLAP